MFSVAAAKSCRPVFNSPQTMNTLPTITCVVLGLSSVLVAQDATGVEQTKSKVAKSQAVRLQSVGPIAFAAGHTLLVSDPKAAVISRRPLDNVGVQYGLDAFNAGIINAEQFLELNEGIGGYDVDGNIVATRSLADREALRSAHQKRSPVGSSG